MGHNAEALCITFAARTLCAALFRRAATLMPKSLRATQIAAAQKRPRGFDLIGLA